MLLLGLLMQVSTHMLGTFCTGTKVQILTLSAQQGQCPPALLVPKYLLYWYKSTNTDAERAAGLPRQCPPALLVPKYLLYWYKSTDTDAERAAGLARESAVCAFGSR
jgi:hypothetical protein